MYFLGYRFPETDNEAMAAILGKVKSCRGRSGINVVLGPDINHTHVRRLDGLFRHADIQATHPIPLFAQDFMTVYAMNSANDQRG